MWDAFVRNLHLDIWPTFQEVMELIYIFLYPAYNHMLDQYEYSGDWDPKSLTWENSQTSVI